MEGSGGDGPSAAAALDQRRHELSKLFQHYLDKSTPHALYRWVGTFGLVLLYALRVYYVQGFYIVTYGLGIYLLNLLIGFLSPLVDPELEPTEGPSLPTKGSDEFKPFIRRLPEFKFWYAITKAFCIAFLMTFFSMFDVPVFWPILLCYWIVLLFLTMKRQIMHMIKYRYIPFNLGKQIIRKLLYLLNQGETFTKTEAAAVLCSVIKLNRFEDIYLRRMLYLIAKELCPIADEVDVVTSSLLKDMKSENVVYRANAIRLLCRITNGTRPTQIEAYLKEAILDHHPMVKSAAIVCAINLLKSDPGIGRNFIEQVRGAVWSQTKLVQFHALCFLFRMHRDDLLAVEKLVTMYTAEIHFKRVTFSSPLSLCLLARSINQITRAMHVSVEQYPCYYTYLKSCIYHGDEMVAVQGVGSLEELNDMSRSELGLAIDVLRLFIHSPKPVVRFGAFRALFKVEVGRDVDWSSCEEHATWMADENIKKYLDYSMYTIDHKEDFLNKEPMPHVVPQVLKSQSNFAKKKEEEAAAAADPTHNFRKRLVSLKLRRIIKD